MRRKDEASAFIIALGILVILFIMAITFATMMMMESRAARNYNDAALCENVARGALEEAINALFRDKYGDDASMVAGSLVLEPYDNDAGDENWDAWAYPGQPGHDDTLWFLSDGGWLSEDASATDIDLDEIMDAGKTWSVNLWQDAIVQVAGQTRTVASNTTDTLTVTEPFDTEPRQGDRYMVFFWYPRDASDDPVVRPLEGGLSARYAILISDDREARVNVNTAGNLAGAGSTHGSNMGASVTEVSLQALLQLFNDRDGSVIIQSDAEALAREIIQARCEPPDIGAGSSAPGGAADDDSDNTDDGVDNDGEGEVDETDENQDEADEFNPLAALEDTPFALPDEAAVLASPADTGDVTSFGPSSLTDDTKSWTDDEWIDATVGVDTDGDGIADQFRTVTINDSDTLDVDSSWGTDPFPGDAYAVYYDSPLEEILEPDVIADPDTSLRAEEATGTSGLTLADCLTTYSAGTLEHPYFDPGDDGVDNDEDLIVDNPEEAFTDPSDPDSLGYDLRRYRFGLNQFDPSKTEQIDDLARILWFKGGLTEDQAYQMIVNLKDALDDDSTVTNYLSYYGVELRPFITEVMREDDPGPPARAYYFIEFYNPSPDPITVFGWDLTVTGGPGGSLSLANDTIPGNGFYVIGGRAAGYVDRVVPGLLREPLPASDITALELTCTNEAVLPDGTVIDKADGFGAFDYTTPKSQERPDFKVDDWTEHATAHTFGSPPYTPDDTNPRGFDEIFALFIVPDYLDLDGSGSIRDEIIAAEVINYDINLANLGDLSRILLMGYTNPATGDPISQMFAQDAADGNADHLVVDFASPADTGTVSLPLDSSSLTDASKAWTDDQWIGYFVGVDTVLGGTLEKIRSITSNTLDTLIVDSPWGTNPPAFGDNYYITDTFYEIKFHPSYSAHQEVLDYLTILNPLGDGLDNDGDWLENGPDGVDNAGLGDDHDRNNNGVPDAGDWNVDGLDPYPDGTDLGGPEHRIPGMININTASWEVLMALPGIDAFETDGVDNDGDASTDEPGEGADVIIDSRPYTEIGDLFSVSGINALGNNLADDNGNGIVDEEEEEYLIFGAISNIVTTHSNVFSVYCLAQVGVWNDLNADDIVDPGEFTTFAERKLMAIVDRSTQPINVRFLRWLSD